MKLYLACLEWYESCDHIGIFDDLEKAIEGLVKKVMEKKEIYDLVVEEFEMNTIYMRYIELKRVFYHNGLFKLSNIQNKNCDWENKFRIIYIPFIKKYYKREKKIK